MNFEDIKVRVPIGYHNILTNCYGDYMQLPPLEKRVTHHNTEIIDTKKSYQEYINRKEK